MHSITFIYNCNYNIIKLIVMLCVSCASDHQGYIRLLIFNIDRVMKSNMVMTMQLIWFSGGMNRGMFW